MNGILLIGMGKNYSKMAYNMALSIKRKEPNLQIAIITDETDTSILEVFDHIIEPELDDYLEGVQFNPFKLKTFIYNYSPFDKTIYLDVDGICLTKFDKLFEHDFLIQEVARYNSENWDKCAMVWVRKANKHLKDIYEAYKLPLETFYPEYNSSFILFSKSAKNKKYFKQVQKNYMDRKLDFKPIGGRYPDELAFNLASAQLNHYSDNEKIKPIYFQWENKTLPLGDIEKKYNFLGMAGGHHSNRLKHIYEITVKQFSPYWKFESKKKIFHEK
jgi:hypothetical protein